MELKFHVQHLSEEPASEADSHAHYIVRLGIILARRSGGPEKLERRVDRAELLWTRRAGYRRYIFRLFGLDPPAPVSYRLDQLADLLAGCLIA